MLLPVLTVKGRCGPVVRHMYRRMASWTCSGCIAVGGAVRGGTTGGGVGIGASVTDDYITIIMTCEY